MALSCLDGLRHSSYPLSRESEHSSMIGRAPPGRMTQDPTRDDHLAHAPEPQRVTW
jgi:hypothetical protein